MITVEALRSPGAVQPLVPAWNALLAESDIDVPFLTPEWFSCWWNVYGKDKEMLVLAARERENVLAIAPLMRSRTRMRGVPVKVLSFMDNYHAGHLGLVMRRHNPLITRALFSYLMAEPRCRCDVYAFYSVPAGSDSARTITEGFALSRLRHIERPGDDSPYIPVTMPWEDYFKTRSKNFRHKLTRIRNLFDRRGQFEVVKYEGPDTGRPMEELLAVSRASWKFKEGSSIANTGHNHSFYRELARAAAARGWLNLWVLKLGGRPAAFAYNLQRNRRVYALEIGFDETCAEMSPSEFLNTCAIQDCFENGGLEYDWLGKATPFKMKWTDVSRPHRKFTAFAPTPAGRLLHFLETRAVPLAKKAVRRKEPASRSE